MMNVVNQATSSTMHKKALASSETSVSIYKTSQQTDILQDLELCSYGRHDTKQNKISTSVTSVNVQS
jgi:hypothetical protein